MLLMNFNSFMARRRFLCYHCVAASLAASPLYDHVVVSHIGYTIFKEVALFFFATSFFSLYFGLAGL
jgi:hypothetical protein